MTYPKLSGVYFEESVTTNTNEYDQDYCPLFLIETATSIPALDGVTTEFTNFDAFYAVAKDKGLPQTLKYIEDIINEGNKGKFYVHSIKAQTASVFASTLLNTGNIDDITSVTYIEETKSTENQTLANKIANIRNGLIENAKVGAFRVGYIIPYGTAKDAVTDPTGTKEQAMVSVMESITDGEGHGRICIILPDSNAGIVNGKCIGTAYNNEVGFTPVTHIDTTEMYHFTYEQLLTLQNSGVLFLKEETIQGNKQYRINLGVTTSFKSSKADGQLISRNIYDEVLREIKWISQAFVKAKESETTIADFNAQIGLTLQKYKNAREVYEDGTELTATDGGNGTFYVTGTIKPVKSIIAIEVETVLS